jgi:hypothetical protein
MALLTFTYIIVAFLVVFLLPGLTVVEAVAPGKYRGARMALASAVGVALVCYLSLTVVGFLGLQFPVHMTGPLVAGVAVSLTLVSFALVAYRRGGAGPAIRDLGTTVKGAWNWRLAAFLLVVTTLYLVGYDSAAFDQERCISRACLLPLHSYLLPDLPLYFDGCTDCFQGRNAFFLWNGHQRMGPSVFVAPFVALFGFPGFRLLHAFMGLLAGWFGYHAGREVLGQPRYGYVVGFLMACNPWALGISLVDENILCLGLGSVILYLVVARRTQWLLVALFFGLFVGIRHVGLLALPAVLYAVVARGRQQQYRAAWYHRYFGSEPISNLTTICLGIVLFSLPWIFVHTRAWMVGLPVYESFAGLPAMTHRFLGLEFTLHGLLNWPFIEVPVRSPFNGFPNFVALPLQVISTLGLLGLAMVAIGAVRSWQQNRQILYFGLLWTLPLWALLSVTANWIEPNKTGIFLCFVQPVVLAVGMGVCGIVEGWRKDRLARPSLIGAGVLLLGGGALLALPGYHAPMDARSLQARPEYAEEVFPVTPPLMVVGEADYAAVERHRLTRVNLLPDYRDLPFLRSFTVARVRVRQLWRDFSAPRPGQYCARPKDLLHSLSGIPNPMSGESVSLARMMHRPVTRFCGTDLLPPPCQEEIGTDNLVGVRLDLSASPAASDQLLTGAAVTDLPAAGRGVLFATLGQLSWSNGHAVHVAVIPGGPGEVWVMVWYGAYSFDHLAHRTDVSALAVLEEEGIEFAVQGDALVRVVDISSAAPNRFHVWFAPADELDEVMGPYASSY